MQTAIKEVHRSIFKALTSYAPLMEKVTGVLDGVNETQGFPYIEIGEPTINPWNTKNTIGENIVFVLHTWSKYPGYSETYDVMNLIYAAMTEQPLTMLGGFSVKKIESESKNAFKDIDGKTRHGVMNFRVYVNN
ncbi:DUF3168 domain-containing protein [Salimicrobium jeotgali]|uniref:DUF3168 domain-containing protein n=1 Tax=Salimicrobium jeotgali TaxID=1230341 RepID=UPI0015E09B01|nr:DUF3168 domain-containing protein [Salimicrobium jeotgali]